MYTGETQVIQESKIKDLGILTFLAMLRIDKFAESGAQGPHCPEKSSLLAAFVRESHENGGGAAKSIKKRVDEM